MHSRILSGTLSAALVFLFVSFMPEAEAEIQDANMRLERGDVVITHRKEGDVEFVEARIRIRRTAQCVWPILANPYEFESRIAPRFHTVQVLTDEPDVSLLRCRVDLGFLLPCINYTVESRYLPGRKISFRSQGGDLKDFRGYWGLEPAAGGKECEVTYSMYCEPGIPVPQWLMRQGIRFELPHTLTGLRDRVEAICARREMPVTRTLSAAGSLVTL